MCLVRNSSGPAQALKTYFCGQVSEQCFHLSGLRHFCCGFCRGWQMSSSSVGTSSAVIRTARSRRRSVDVSLSSEPANTSVSTPLSIKSTSASLNRFLYGGSLRPRRRKSVSLHRKCYFYLCSIDIAIVHMCNRGLC